MDNAPSNEFFLEYIARPQTAEIFFEEILMACVFYGMPILCENNKPRLLYHLKNRGYRGFSINRPDKTFNKLSKTEKESDNIAKSGHGNFTANNNTDHPGRCPAQGSQHYESGRYQELVCHRIHNFTQIRYQAESSGKVTVKVVGDSRSAE